MRAWQNACVAWLCCAWLAAPLAAAPVDVAVAPAAPSPTTIHVVAPGNYPPYLFIGADGKVQGYEADRWRLFEQHTGIHVDLAVVEWQVAKADVQHGYADVIDLIYQSTAREAQYDFSAPYATLPLGIYVGVDNHDVHDLPSLRGATVNVGSGSVCANMLAKQGVADLRAYAEYEDAVKAAAGSAPHIFCMDENRAYYYQKKYGLLGLFRRAFVLDNGHFHLAVRKGNTTMLQLVERGMAQITPAEKAALEARWLRQASGLSAWSRVAMIALATALLLAALMTLWIWALRRSVAARTRELEVGEAELRLAAVAFDTQEALLVMDADRTIERINRAFTAATGHTSAIIGQRVNILRSRYHPTAFYDALWEEVARAAMWQGELWIQSARGVPKAMRMTVSSVFDTAGKVSHYVCSMLDITEQREAHARVDRLTFFDPLTDLPNRHFLQVQLQHLQESSGGGALLLADLDHFKRINDLRGHATGDHLLALVAQRLREGLDEHCVLSRFSGGTFALLASCAGDEPMRLEQACECAESMRRALREPFELEGHPVLVTVSIGWTVLLPGQGSPEAVLKEAELAMYQAKAAGRDQVRCYEPTMQSELLQHEALIGDLRQAIDAGELALHYQAQTDRHGRYVGAEALLRWIRADGERVPPDVFIPIAEENGLILPLGQWVLQRACEQLARWASDVRYGGLTLAVNVSARQFAQADFVDGVRAVLASTGAEPRRLKLEITETAILDDLDDSAAKLAQLRALGMRTSLDDFGTGYSSLAYLSRLPLDQLKIDQSFVARLPDDPSDAMVAQTIIAMGRGLGLEVIAEGVETTAQHQFLLAQGCDAFQGYLISRPLPLVAFEALLAERAAINVRGGN